MEPSQAHLEDPGDKGRQKTVDVEESKIGLTIVLQNSGANNPKLGFATHVLYSRRIVDFVRLRNSYERKGHGIR